MGLAQVRLLALFFCCVYGHGTRQGLHHRLAVAEAPDHESSVGYTGTLGLKTLLLYTSPADLQIARIFFNGLSTPYDAQTAIPDLSLPYYHAIVVTNDAFDMAPLRRYARRLQVRIVSLATHRDQTLRPLGVSVAPLNAGETHVGLDRATLSARPEVGDALNEKGAWPVVFLDPLAYAIDSGEDITPVLRYGQPGSAMNGSVAAFIAKTMDGTEEMHFGFSANTGEFCYTCGHPSYDVLTNMARGEYSYINLALANMWFSWVTRGIYLGMRRVSFNVHVDDFFLPTFRYNGVPSRMNGNDLDRVAQFVDTLSGRLGLPKGSNFTFQLAFNGAGCMAMDTYDKTPGWQPSLNEAVTRNIGKFLWVSHTWSHQNLDYVWDCKVMGPPCYPSAEKLDAEIKNNARFARGEEVKANRSLYPTQADTPGGLMFAGNPELAERVYSRHSIVTPQISGLTPTSAPFTPGPPPNRPGNFLAVKILLANGITAAVGDNTRRELVSKVSPHHPVISKEGEYGVEGFAIIPRIAPTIPLGASDEASYVQYFNSPITGLGACPLVSGPPCEARQYTMDEGIDRNAFSALQYLLQFRQDPYMTHQGNLATFIYRNSTIALNTHWVEKTLTRLMTYVNKLPVVSVKMDDSEAIFRARQQRDLCGLMGTLNVTNGTWTCVTIQSDKACTAVLTTLRANRLQPLIANKEVYGLDNTFRVDMPGNATALTFAIHGDKETLDVTITPHASSAPRSGGCLLWFSILAFIVFGSMI